MIFPQIACSLPAGKWRRHLWMLIAAIFSGSIVAAAPAEQSQTSDISPITGTATNLETLVLTNFVVRGFPGLDAATVNDLLSKYKGTNVPVTDLVKAATEIQAECDKRGRAG